VLSDAVTIVAARYSASPPDAKFPYGYGKWEGLATMWVAVSLVAGRACHPTPHPFPTRYAPLYSKKLEASVVSSVILELTTDTRPTAFSALSSYSTPNCKSV